MKKDAAMQEMEEKYKKYLEKAKTVDLFFIFVFYCVGILDVPYRGKESRGKKSRGKI